MIQDQRDNQCENHFQRSADQRKITGHTKRLGKGFILGENADIVVQANKFRRILYIIFTEGIIQAQHHRNQHEQQETHDERQAENKSGGRFLMKPLLQRRLRLSGLNDGHGNLPSS